MKLSPDQVQFFRHCGFLRLPNRLDSPTVEKLLLLVESFVRQGGEGVTHDAVARTIKVSSLIHRDPFFREVFSSAQFVQPLTSLLGINIELLTNRHNHATLTLQGNTNTRLHRDTLQWSRSVVTAILYLEDADAENGCTHVVPGSQFFAFVEVPNNGGTWMDEHEKYAGLLAQALPVPMAQGGILLFDSLVFHGTGANRSPKSCRPIISMAFTSVDELLGLAELPFRVLISGKRIYKGNVPAARCL